MVNERVAWPVEALISPKLANYPLFLADSTHAASEQQLFGPSSKGTRTVTVILI